MYGLPENFDGSFLIGRTVEEVCFAKYQASVDFSGNVWVAMEGAYIFYHSDSAQDKKIIDIQETIEESDLMKLLGSRVAEVHGDDEGTLLLKFDNGYILECYDDPYYESYFINDGKNTIIV